MWYLADDYDLNNHTPSTNYAIDIQNNSTNKTTPKRIFIINHKKHIIWQKWDSFNIENVLIHPFDSFSDIQQ